MIHKAIMIITSVFLLTVAVAANPLPQLFVASDRCQACHNGLVTTRGEDVSIGIDWRLSMMANAARDPYWQAAVRRETLVHPSAKAVIEHECSACHMPMARYTAKAAGEKGTVFEHLPVTRQITFMDKLAADGVSCAMCHQIGKDKLGEKESFTAGFVVDTTTAFGERKVFGPYDVDEGRKSLMRSSSQFVPNQAVHIQSSELCASCHTLFTHALNDNGELLGEFPEQVPYLEWKHSSYYNSRSCQSCHMPQLEGEMPISGVMGKGRENVSRHAFRGGNFFMPRILNRNRHKLGVVALPQELDAAFSRTVEHLRASAANIAVRDAGIKDGSLRAEVWIENLAGHKLPSAYPSRRVWVHFVVLDRNGHVVFESGRLNEEGSIVGNDNDRDGNLYESHYTVIDDPQKVQIYESIMGDSENKITTVLLSSACYLKDNRLLPDGFEKETADGDCAVQGSAVDDADFRGGGDRVLYTIPVSIADGPFKIQAELWYQPIGFRWAHNLEQQKAVEISRFVSYYNALSGSSGTILAKAEAMAE